MARKTILITGCSGEIGKKIITNFFKKKYLVIGLDKNAPQKKSELDLFIKCDLTSELQLKKIFKRIANKYKSIDVVINCAGFIHNELLISYNKKFIFHSYKNWKKVFDNNLNSVFAVTQNCLELLMKSSFKKKIIINFSSVNSSGIIGQSAYSASKKAIEVLTKIWSHELSPFKIRVACISPGYMNLASTHNKLSELKKRSVISEIPLKKFGDVKSIIDGINFIINNNYFNGKNLKIDGGL